MSADDRYDPDSVDASREDGVVIVWSDGHESTWTLEEVRLACRCAHCNDARDAGRPAWRPNPQQPLDVVDARLQGSYGISFHWSDGHQTGIYRWTDLRDMCGCTECVASRSG